MMIEEEKVMLAVLVSLLFIPGVVYSHNRYSDMAKKAAEKTNIELEDRESSFRVTAVRCDWLDDVILDNINAPVDVGLCDDGLLRWKR